MSTGVIFILGKGVTPILAYGVKSTWPQGSSAPGFSTMLRIEKLCLAVGFTHEQTAHLMTGKPLPYNGELYSDEHRRKFKTNDVTAKVGTNNGKLILAIDGLHIGEWFKKQFERLQQNVGLKPIQKKNKGFKL